MHIPKDEQPCLLLAGVYSDGRHLLLTAGSPEIHGENTVDIKLNTPESDQIRMKQNCPLRKGCKVAASTAINVQNIRPQYSLRCIDADASMASEEHMK